jgi:hypothetical protein
MPLEGFDDADIPPRDMGRRSGPGSSVKIDLGVLERGASIGCTMHELKALSGTPHSTFFKHLAEDPEVKAAIERGAELGRATLRRAQWQAAVSDKNPTMLVWLGKQLLGQQDSLTLTADLNIHRVLSEAPLTIEQWTALNVTKPDDET